MSVNSDQAPRQEIAPLAEHAPVIPEHVFQRLQHIQPPALLYDLRAFKKSVRQVVEAFDAYYFPVKCNPTPEILKAAAQQGAGLDVCSPQEFVLAMKSGVKSRDISHTGVALDSGGMSDMNSLGVRINLDSIQELEQWLVGLLGQPAALRLKAGENDGYATKFGISDVDLSVALKKIRAAGTRLEGLHVHFDHVAENPTDLALEYAPTLTKITTLLADHMPDISYLNLGGGWPFFHGARQQMGPLDFAAAIQKQFGRSLKEAGFSGEIIVEPGEFVAADCGYWVAKVAVLKPGEQQTVAILDTITPIPSAKLPYPVTVLRKKNGRFHPVTGERTRCYTLTGVANSPLDTIRESVRLPELKPEDIIVLGGVGAYLGTLMGGFHSRPTPKQYVVE